MKIVKIESKHRNKLTSALKRERLYFEVWSTFNGLFIIDGIVPFGKKYTTLKQLYNFAGTSLTEWSILKKGEFKLYFCNRIFCDILICVIFWRTHWIWYSYKNNVSCGEKYWDEYLKSDYYFKGKFDLLYFSLMHQIKTRGYWMIDDQVSIL
jgi:hypothetical protein